MTFDGKSYSAIVTNFAPFLIYKSRMMKRVQTLIVTVGIIFAALFCSCGKDKSAPQKQSEYETMQISRNDARLESRFTATLRGKQDVEIRPQVSGTITELCVEEGALVKKGQAICIIDQVPYQAALETAEANVAVAEANVATAKLTAESKGNLYKQGIISYVEKQTADNALRSHEATLALAKAELKNASNNLSYTVVKSPVDGKIGMIPYKVGALVVPTIEAPITSISDNSVIYAYFSMTEREILSLAKEAGSLEKAIENMPDVELCLSDGSKYSKVGEIDAVSNIVDGSTGAISLRATFKNDDHVIASGGSGTLMFPYVMDNAIIIPQSATFEVQDKVYVYKVVDGKATATMIGIFPIDDGKTYIVREGLDEGDIIVAEGVGLMKEGTPINIKKTVKSTANDKK